MLFRRLLIKDLNMILENYSKRFPNTIYNSRLSILESQSRQYFVKWPSFQVTILALEGVWGESIKLQTVKNINFTNY
jgi:hypothetical protein